MYIIYMIILKIQEAEETSNVLNNEGDTDDLWKRVNISKYTCTWNNSAKNNKKYKDDSETEALLTLIS